MSKPAHKQDDPKKYPGQIRNDITLSDYIERKSKGEQKKLTFDEWVDSLRYNEQTLILKRLSTAQWIWKVAQENK